MKKFTLLAGLALLAGSGVVSAQKTEIQGLKMSTDTEKHYYQITNMRAQRLSYITGSIYGGDGYEEADIIGEDGAVVPLSAELPNGDPTPEIFTKPYMGLSTLAGNWWLSFSAQDNIKDPNTTYWYFTEGGRGESVYIHNAVMDGTVARSASRAQDAMGYSRSNMGFDLDGENRYYVLKSKDAIEEEGWLDELLDYLTEEELDDSYAFCVGSSFTASSTNCLDMNNYINYTELVQQIDENGDTVFDEDGDPVMLKYGFAGMDRTWSPTHTNGDGGNQNHLMNNGSLFFVTEASNADAEAAIEAYKDVIAKGFRDGATADAKTNFNSAIETLKGWLNVPALWEDQVALQGIIDYCANWNGEGLDVSAVHNLETRLAYAEAAKELAQAKVAEAAALIGSNPIITLQNQLALRDVESAEDEATAEEYQLGNAYITAGGYGYYRQSGAMMESMNDEYTAIQPMLEATPEAEWELQNIAGTTSFLLYNPATETYIRRYENMYELAAGEEEIGEADEFVWATTKDASLAAPFQLIGCPDPANQAAISEDEEIMIEDYAINTEITDNVRLTSVFTTDNVETDADGNEVVTTTTTTTNIHRGSLGSGYMFVNWTATKNWWFADSNAFHVAVVKKGAINEINADLNKANTVYDLQGRRVAKAGKGLYIINGVKTLVR